LAVQVLPGCVHSTIPFDHPVEAAALPVPRMPKHEPERVGSNLFVNRLRIKLVSSRKSPHDAELLHEGFRAGWNRVALPIEPTDHAAVLMINGVVNPKTQDTLLKVVSEFG
jgi:hypothetical protein